MTKARSPRFEVLVNGRKAGIAGISEYGVVSVIVGLIKGHPERFPGTKGTQYTKRSWSRPHLHLYIGGLELAKDERNDRHVQWLKRGIKPGDKIVVRVLGAGPFDAPKIIKRRLTARSRGTRAKAARAPHRGR
jgi:hypothetical protein